MKQRDRNLKKEFAEELAAKGCICLPAAYAVHYAEGKYKLQYACDIQGAHKILFFDGMQHVMEMPYIDVDDLYEACGGRFVASIICKYLKEFIQRYEKALEAEQAELEQMKQLAEELPADKIFMMLISYKEDRCSNLPGRRCGSFYLIYRVLIDRADPKDEGQIKSMLITQELMKKWKVCEEELFEIAKRSMPALFPYEIEEIGKNIYVVSTQYGCYGTGTLFYTESPLKDLGMLLDEILYVLPLSVHEVVVSKLDESKDEMLKSIVKEISAFGLECWYYNKILDRLAFTEKEQIAQEMQLKDGILDPVERREIDAGIR